MKHIRVVACMLMLALAGCDNNDKAPIAAKNDAPAAQPAAEKKAEKDTAQLQKLARGQSADAAVCLRGATGRCIDAGVDLFHPVRS